MPTMTEDQRISPRIDFHLPLEIKGHEGAKRIKDFSLKGLFVEVADPARFELGDEVSLNLELPYADKPVVVKARVVRVTGDGIGVEFKELYLEDRLALEECYGIFKHTLPLPDAED
jgi:hypothetical protein